MSQLKHLAIIMDGNGRWAEARGKSRSRGHIAGVQAAHRIIEHVVHLEIPVLSLFAFSTENWKRPKREVETLMTLLRTYLKQTERTFHENRIRFDFIGDTSALSSGTVETLEGLRERTSRYSKTTLILAVNYSGQQDIEQAAKALALSGEPVTHDALESRLQTAAYGPVDLLLRTGGEQRLSNFYLWQAAYAEIHFNPKYWPDFKTEDLDIELKRFAASERRFGGLGEIPMNRSSTI